MIPELLLSLLMRSLRFEADHDSMHLLLWRAGPDLSWVIPHRPRGDRGQSPVPGSISH